MRKSWQRLLLLAAGEVDSVGEQFLPGDIELLLRREDTQFVYLLPLIVHNLRRSGLLDTLAGPLRHQLLARNRAVLAHDVVQRHWLDHFLSLKLPTKLPVVLLKGAAFADNVYSADAPRPAADIDVLVRPEDFERMCAHLDGLGGQVQHDTFRPYTQKTLFEAGYRMPGLSSILVEVHRGLTKPHLFNIDYPGLWERSVESPRFGCPSVRVLSAEDTLLHLAIHAYRHGTVPAYALVDTFMVMTKWEPNAGMLIDRAHSWGAATVLLALVRQVGSALNAPLAAELIPHLKPGPVRRALLDRLFPVDGLWTGHSNWTRSQQVAALGLLDRWYAPVTFASYYLCLRLIDLAWRAKEQENG